MNLTSWVHLDNPRPRCQILIHSLHKITEQKMLNKRIIIYRKMKRKKREEECYSPEEFICVDKNVDEHTAACVRARALSNRVFELRIVRKLRTHENFSYSCCACFFFRFLIFSLLINPFISFHSINIFIVFFSARFVLLSKCESNEKGGKNYI